MEFEKMIEVDNLVFQKIAEVGNLSWAGSTWAKTGQKPITNPRANVRPGASFLSVQNFSIRQTVERFPNMSGIIKLPTAYK